MIRNWLGLAQNEFTRNTIIGKILRFPLRMLPSNMQVPILSGKLRGKKWIIDSGVHRYWLGTYELEKQDKFTQMVSPENIVFDIGANVGFYSLLASILVGDQGRVISFEPVKRNINYLRQHLAINKIENVTVMEAAVSDRDGLALFDPSPEASTGHFSETGAERVQTVSIDNLIEHNQVPFPHVMKIDIEGAEILALIGAQNTINNAHPIIFLATHGETVHRSSCDLLFSWGYSLTPIDATDLDHAREILAIHHSQQVKL